ncbi:unnamed protein product [Ectocarpus fasciculatus]
MFRGNMSCVFLFYCRHFERPLAYGRWQEATLRICGTIGNIQLAIQVNSIFLPRYRKAACLSLIHESFCLGRKRPSPRRPARLPRRPFSILLCPKSNNRAKYTILKTFIVEDENSEWGGLEASVSHAKALRWRGSS